MKRGREHQGCGEENNVEKGKKRKIIPIIPIILRIIRRILSGEKGKGTKISGKKIKILNMGVGKIKNIKL